MTWDLLTWYVVSPPGWWSCAWRLTGWMVLLDENRVAFQAGQEVPHILNTTFFNVFVWMGGSGSIIGLAILLMFFSKSQRNKELGKLGFAPNVFNISEPIMFGLPVVMNPLILIPFCKFHKINEATMNCLSEKNNIL